jgi:hypothetical protein
MNKTVIVRLDEALSGGAKIIYFFADERSGPSQVTDVSSPDQLVSVLQGQGFSIVDKTSRVTGDRRITDWKLSKDFQTPWG